MNPVIYMQHLNSFVKTSLLANLDIKSPKTLQDLIKNIYYGLAVDKLTSDAVYRQLSHIHSPK